MAGLPPTIIPPSAKTERAKKFWQMHPFQRVKDVLDPSEETVNRYTVSLLESFSIEELHYAVTNMLDISPILVKKAELEHFILKPIASGLIHLHWTKILNVLSHPKSMIVDRIRQYDPQKADLLASPAGELWLNWTVWRTMVVLAYYGKVNMKGQTINPPPGKCPLRSMGPIYVLPPGNGKP